MKRIHVWANRWLISYNPDKTELVLFSLRDDICSLKLLFDDKLVKNVENHKHLGLIFSSNGKWSTHVSAIVSKTSKMISSMRKLKYLLNRNTLLKIYTVFIRPHFEYASEVWDGCGKDLSLELERLQMEAARIITGLPKYSSFDSLYYETGLEALSERRRIRKLSLFYNIQNNNSPMYLKEIVPDMVGSRSHYNLRNSSNITLPKTRIKISHESFFPSTIRLWNNLSSEIRNCPSVSKFKLSIKAPTASAPLYFSYGVRKLNILHTQLRHTASRLNYDLYRVGLIEDSSCACGNPCENSYHYFIEFPMYRQNRTTMFKSIQDVLDCNIVITLSIVLNGIADMANYKNEMIFKCVQSYISKSRRFQ